MKSSLKSLVQGSCRIQIKEKHDQIKKELTEKAKDNLRDVGSCGQRSVMTTS